MPVTPDDIFKADAPDPKLVKRIVEAIDRHLRSASPESGVITIPREANWSRGALTEALRQYRDAGWNIVEAPTTLVFSSAKDRPAVGGGFGGARPTGPFQVGSVSGAAEPLRANVEQAVADINEDINAKASPEQREPRRRRNAD